MRRAVVWCDGSGTTGGPAGIAYVGHLDTEAMDDLPLEGSLSLPNATNQQAEILAAAYALHELDPCDHVTVVSDSEYVVLGMNERLVRWIARGWRTTTGPVANRRHWERLLDAVARHEVVVFEWTRGHAGTPENERADQLAVAARLRAREQAVA